MDDSIVSREEIRQRGADAFDRGIPVDGHGMNWFVPAIEDWQKGWRDRQAVVYAREVVKFASGVGTPP
jgi:hypothetical protein